MLFPGLVSITFRKLPPAGIVALARETGLEAIEWGGDTHVPPGDREGAAAIGALTRNAGLRVASYGSYYRAGHSPPAEFEDVLAAALALRAPVIRIWAGRRGSGETDADTRQRIVADSRRVARMAAAAGLTVAYEYHGRTLTDTCEGTLELLRETGEPNLRTHWQPAKGSTLARNLDELKKLRPYLCHLHVFHWRDTQRRPLAEGAGEWRAYLEAVSRTGQDHGVLLEFVASDKPDNLRADARTLRELF